MNVATVTLASAAPEARRETENMTAAVLRDAETVPERVGASFAAAARDVLLHGWDLVCGNRHEVRSAIGHALRFQTWRSLLQEEGLGRDSAVDLMTSFVGRVSSGKRPHTRRSLGHKRRDASNHPRGSRGLGGRDVRGDPAGSRLDRGAFAPREVATTKCKAGSGRSSDPEFRGRLSRLTSLERPCVLSSNQGRSQ